MSKIIRPDLDPADYVFGSTAQGTERTIFGAYTGLVQSDDLTENITASFQRGWAASGEQNNSIPTMEDFNGWAFTTSKMLAYLFQMGVGEWNGKQLYPVNARCIGSNGILYRAKVENEGNDPVSDNVNWGSDADTFVPFLGNVTIGDVKTFSSSPIVPTATLGDSSGKAANTAFVQRVAGMLGGLPISSDNEVGGDCEKHPGLGANDADHVLRSGTWDFDSGMANTPSLIPYGVIEVWHDSLTDRILQRCISSVPEEGRRLSATRQTNDGGASFEDWVYDSAVSQISSRSSDGSWTLIGLKTGVIVTILIDCLGTGDRVSIRLDSGGLGGRTGGNGYFQIGQSVTSLESVSDSFSFFPAGETAVLSISALDQPSTTTLYAFQ